MRLMEVLKNIETVEIAGNADVEVTGVVCDSRQVRPGHIFVAIPGTTIDGWNFVMDAMEQGAVCIVSEHSVSCVGNGLAKYKQKIKNGVGSMVCFVQVKDARGAAGKIASAFYNFPSRYLEVIGVTGTNGKTTVCYLTRKILQVDGRNPGMIGTIEYQVGDRIIPASRTTPDATVLQDLLAQMVASKCRSVVMEVSSHGLVQKRVEGIDFDVAVFTNITRDHLDYHGTMEKYFEAKSLLFLGLGRQTKKAVAVINVDNEWGRRLCKMSEIKADIVTYGLQTESDVHGLDYRTDETGSSFRVVSPWGTAEIKTSLVGRYNASNILAAIAVGGVLNIKLDKIVSAVKGITFIPGRLEKIETGLGFQVYIDYAHTDDALRNVLSALRETKPRRIILVFGCGGNRDKAKRPVMGTVAANFADYSIITSDNPRTEDPMQIIKEIKAGFGEASNYEIIPDREKAIARAVEMAQGGDIVLIAGKGHETYQEFANRIIPFDDHKVVQRYLDKERSVT
jgi:UDP-N-acetylmuramoyl-L-alanyl-D-glutamate--2,6-diaminopimelate ligase